MAGYDDRGMNPGVRCTGKCVTSARAGLPEIAFVYRDPYCPLHGDAVADVTTLRESLRWVRGELRKADAENNASTFLTPQLRFLKAALGEDEESRNEALRVLSTLTLDDLYELMISSAWIRNAVGRQIQMYENGVVQRYVPGRNDHD